MIRFVMLLYDIYFNRSDLSLFVYGICKFFVDVIFGYVVNVSKVWNIFEVEKNGVFIK